MNCVNITLNYISNYDGIYLKLLTEAYCSRHLHEFNPIPFNITEICKDISTFHLLSDICKKLIRKCQKFWKSIYLFNFV